MALTSDQQSQVDALKRYQLGYAVQPGDVLEIFVYRHQELSRKVVVRPDGKVSVRNSCHEAMVRGPLKVSDGVAVPAGDRLGAKFKVSFFGPALLTNYWVLDRADDYGWAIVGEGSGRFLWLLTREPRPSQAVREAMLARVERLGYDTHMLRYTQHLRTGP